MKWLIPLMTALLTLAPGGCGKPCPTKGMCPDRSTAGTKPMNELRTADFPNRAITGFLVGDTSCYRLLDLRDSETIVNKQPIVSQYQPGTGDGQTITTHHILRLSFIAGAKRSSNKIALCALFGPNPGSTTASGYFYYTNGGHSFRLLNGWIMFTSAFESSYLHHDFADVWEPVQTERVVAMAEGTTAIVQVDGRARQHRVFFLEKHSGSGVQVQLKESGRDYKPIGQAGYYSEINEDATDMKDAVRWQDTDLQLFIDHVTAAKNALNNRC